MKVYIVNYKGTIYGVFDSEDKAYAYAKNAWGESAIMSLSVTILEKDVL